MSLHARHATRSLYRDAYDLIPLLLARALPHSPVQSAPIRLQPCQRTRQFSTTVRRRLDAVSCTTASRKIENTVVEAKGIILPLSCPGCGAPTQSLYAGEAGFYSPTRAAVKKYLDPAPKKEASVLKTTLQNVSPELRRQLGMDNLEEGLEKQNDSQTPVPICDRCHNLLHHHSGVPINHPSMRSIEATIAESPYKHNHIYHVLDAADFPMTLIPNLNRHLDFANLRTRNRRSKSQHWTQGRTGDMSFIITRSDLLAPKKEQVDAMMPTILEILRDALGRTGENVRLGNVRCVSSKRGWWTKEVKQSIWKHGGGSWLVGQVNVGKSNLFEVVFPKGTLDETPNFDKLRNEARKDAVLSQPESDPFGEISSQVENTESPKDALDEKFDDTLSLLPPPQPETKYPVMPIISELPGTTASPIRVPFGNGKGELIDLPGLDRATLEAYVKPENRLDIIMKKRVAPERIVIKPGSSLLFGGGLVRITPTTPDIIVMAHAFVPLSTHLTSTTKAQEIQSGERASGIKSILDSAAQSKVAFAGTFQLNTDVTKRYAGPLTRRDAAALKPSQLPFIVYATDILIAGCGWIELVCQVRKPKPTDRDAFTTIEPLQAMVPEVEVFTPEGKGVGQRRSLGAWAVGGPKAKGANAKGRPRKSMKGEKMRGKREE